MDIAGMLAEFHETFYGEPYGQGPRDHTLRRTLHEEEGQELLAALTFGGLTGIAQELADVVYVAYGTAHSLGIPLDAVIAEIHRANMAKVGPDGRPRRRADGKILKPDAWRPADIEAVLRDHEAARR